MECYRQEPNPELPPCEMRQTVRCFASAEAARAYFCAGSVPPVAKEATLRGALPYRGELPLVSVSSGDADKGFTDLVLDRFDFLSHWELQSGMLRPEPGIL